MSVCILISISQLDIWKLEGSIFFFLLFFNDLLLCVFSVCLCLTLSQKTILEAKICDQKNFRRKLLEHLPLERVG